MKINKQFIGYLIFSILLSLLLAIAVYIGFKSLSPYYYNTDWIIAGFGISI